MYEVRYINLSDTSRKMYKIYTRFKFSNLTKFGNKNAHSVVFKIKNCNSYIYSLYHCLVLFL